jgi:hypothetical protein
MFSMVAFGAETTILDELGPAISKVAMYSPESRKNKYLS